jgi:5-methyltetrahydrofolate--homocysteine methyltransferase
MLIIGEKINGTISRVKEAVDAHDEQFIIDLARQQIKNGADVIDVNVGAGENEAENLAWAVRVIQKDLDAPLMLDSGNPDALRAAMDVYQGRPILNSISGEEWKMEKLLPLISKGNCSIVALCMDDDGMPATPEDTLNVAEKIVDRLTGAGVGRDDIYLDPLVLSNATEFQAAKIATDTLRQFGQELPQVRTIMAISNISFGLPCRRLLNRGFLAAAVVAGLDAFLVDVNDKSLMAMVWAANLLSGNDEGCRSYLKAYRQGMLTVS